MEKATFAAGCFWGVQVEFDKIKGIGKTTVGYTGGHTKDPKYDDVCEGDTGHAEAIEIEFDPKKITYKELLKVFWGAHNPTTSNRQGPDIGEQYRSVIFYHSKSQKEEAEASKKLEQNKYVDPIVTSIEPAKTFYSAEEYHQKYSKKHGKFVC